MALAPEIRERCVASDDALDAVLSSLIARAAARGLTRRPETMEQTTLAEVEGWIHLPERRTLPALI